MHYTCAIVEKEPLAEATLKKYISRTSFLDLVWTASSAEEALTKEVVDLLLVAATTASVMQDRSFKDLLAAHEQVIITSVYPRETKNKLPNLVAFLTKPISFDAFIEAIERFLERKI